jgi:hypothetical protein
MQASTLIHPTKGEPMDPVTRDMKEPSDGKVAKIILIAILVVIGLAWAGLAAEYLLSRSSKNLRDLIVDGLALLMLGGLILSVVSLGACVVSLVMRRWFLALANAAAVGGFCVTLPFLMDKVFAGAGWGRPLRIRGRLVHPRLTQGADWASHENPDTSGLDPASAKALEALWLHDAQKEHASVPAFSRLSWQLIGVGAPPELVTAVHQAALEEIDHARKCFALARAFGGRASTALPMPELLVSPLGIRGNAYVHLALESLSDGCVLEDFNAAVAAACAAACVESVTKSILEQIAREEASHAEISWRIIEFCLEREPEKVARQLHRSLQSLGGVARPTAVSAVNKLSVAVADARTLRQFGRLPDEEWELIWSAQLLKTKQRLSAMLHESAPEAWLRATRAA